MSRFSSLLLSCIIVFLGAIHSPAQAQSRNNWLSSYDFTQRYANREKGRWSLSDWLALKDRNRQMDMWLSMNAPSPFEFMIGGSYASYQTDLHDNTEQKSYTSYSGELAAYAQLVGLSAEYEHNTAENLTDLAGQFNLRVFGNSIQNSSLVLSYGLRTRDQSTPTATKISQQYGQAELQLYIFKYFGLTGKYRYFLPTTNADLGDLNSDLTEYGAFIDFKALRIFGAYYKESQKSKLAPAITDTLVERSGIKSGIKIFF
ncbi:hypothetical protein [Bdellovibrio svalbardensis]|uniref:Uncharacterized protein n=1 Tax=Bdellovibrio svalbardensis TaxID=2972972 RepID=A0ABT6DM82_9BACT|nr:hypothetical protein [Bdellovibrio svalbardensis]MDG0817903.1 hypothetical protein [Bdellovibrio svalbardensis]